VPANIIVGGSDPYSLAMVYAALGKKDEAFRLLLRAVEESPQLLGYVNTDPKFDSLRSDPRWKEVLRRLNLPTDGHVSALVDSR
jgi:hypothetical protein